MERARKPLTGLEAKRAAVTVNRPPGTLPASKKEPAPELEVAPPSPASSPVSSDSDYIPNEFGNRVEKPVSASPRRVALYDTGLLLEGEKSRRLRESTRIRAAALREKYTKEKPPSHLETMSELREAFMSPEKRAELAKKRRELAEKRREQAVIKKIPVRSFVKIPVKEKMHVIEYARQLGMFLGFGAVLGGVVSQSTEMRAVISGVPITHVVDKFIKTSASVRELAIPTEEAKAVLRKRQSLFKDTIDHYTTTTEILREVQADTKLLGYVLDYQTAYLKSIDTPSEEHKKELATCEARLLGEGYIVTPSTKDPEKFDIKRATADSSPKRPLFEQIRARMSQFSLPVFNTRTETLTSGADSPKRYISDEGYGPVAALPLTDEAYKPDLIDAPPQQRSN